MNLHSDTDQRDESADVQTLQTDLAESERQITELVDRIRALEEELAFTRHTLAHRVGAAIVNNLSPKRIWRMPGALYRTGLEYKRAKAVHAPRGTKAIRAKDRDQAAEQPASNEAASAPVVHNPRWPTPVDHHLLWQAQHIATADSIASACEFVDTHGDHRHQPALNLLRSNLHIDEDERWLAGVNEYLSQFEIAPLRLTTGTTPRFFRLTTDELVKLADGPLVTVIMPAFNAELTIEKAMRSILDQTWQSLELIVNDDCSTDETYAIAQKIAATDSRVRVYKNVVNVGPYVSKNKALDLARGSYVTGHDADDWAHPQRIERQVRSMQENPDWKVAISYMLRIRENGYFSHLSKMGKTSPDGALRLASISCFFNADFLKNVLGHWDCVRFGADSEMIERCRCILSDQQFGTLRLMTMMCLDGDDSLTNDPNHGISKLTGVSPTRQFYRQQWSAWHEDLTLENAYMAFPETQRKFSAPAEAVVTQDEIGKVLSGGDGHQV